MADDQLFRLLTTALIFIIVGISIVFRHRADRVGGRVARDDEPLPIRLGLSICGLMGFGGLVLYLIWPPAMSATMVPVPAWMRWSALVLVAVGAVGTWWIFSTLGHNVTRTAKTRANATLVTNGPYRYVRHPLYVNAALIFTALSIATRSWWFVLWIAPAVMLLALRARTEEANLEAKFGDRWRAYAARTGRFLPRVAVME